jgi:hypothetical protein
VDGMIHNTDVVKRVLTSLIDISSRKTTESHAITVMGSVMDRVSKHYDFLKHVEVKDTQFLEDIDSVSIMGDLNKVSPTEVGKALYAIIYTMNETLGKDAGYFFIKELSRDIGEDYYTIIKDMGVDLSLLQLETEVSRLERGILRTRKTS